MKIPAENLSVREIREGNEPELREPVPDELRWLVYGMGVGLVMLALSLSWLAG